MNKSLIALALGLTAVLSAQAAQPQVYATLGVTQSHVANSAQDIGVDSFDQNATGGSLAVGATLSRHVAIEAAYYDLGSRDYAIAGDTGRIHSDAYGVNLVLNQQVAPHLTAFLKPGILKTEVTQGASAHQVSLALGAGVDYNLTRHVALETQVQAVDDFANSGKTATFGSVGVKYAF